MNYRDLMKAISRSIIKKISLIIVLLLVVTIQADATKLFHIILAQNSFDPSSGVTMIANSKGYFTKEGLDVQVVNLTAGKLALNAVIGGAADFGTVAETPLVHAGLSGIPVVIIATTETSYKDVRLLAKSSIHHFHDLTGKKIATAIGTNAEYFLTAMLKHHGMTPSEIHLVNLSPQNMPIALETGDIDAYAVWEPFIYRGQRLLGTKAKVFSSGHIYLNYFTITALRGYVKNHPVVVKQFIRALIDARKFIQKHPHQSEAIISRKIGMKINSFNYIWPYFHYRVALDYGLVQLLQKEGKWAIRSGTAPSTANVEALDKMIITGPLHLIDPRLVTGFHH